jgi:hypothetical protein
VLETDMSPHVRVGRGHNTTMDNSNSYRFQRWVVPRDLHGIDKAQQLFLLGGGSDLAGTFSRVGLRFVDPNASVAVRPLTIQP